MKNMKAVKALFVPEGAVQQAYPRTPRDVYHMAFLLRQVLVPDLVPGILESAEYWTKSPAISTQQNERFASKAISPSGMRGQLLYGRATVRSAPVPPKESKRICKVFLKLMVRVNGTFNVGLDDIARLDVWIQPGTPVAGRDDWVSYPPPARVLGRPYPKIRMQRHEKLPFHTFQWSAVSEDSEEAQWVRSLAEGDRIVVDAILKFRFKSLHVLNSQIDLYTSLVRR